MYAPDCPDHGRLVLDLALGRLDDAGAAEAESVRDRCLVCHAWWRAELDGEVAAVVDGAVADALGRVELPRPSRRTGWMAAAATVVMTLGVASLWLAQRPADTDATVPERTAAISTLGFEDPIEVASLMQSEVASEPDRATDESPSPTRHQPTRLVAATAADPPAAAAGDEASAGEVLSADSFETGDLSGWDPRT